MTGSRARYTAPGAIPLRLPFVGFNLDELAREVVTQCFPYARSVTLGFTLKGPLSQTLVSQGGVVVLLHESLNHETTPREVVAYLLKHELLHLECPPAQQEELLVRHGDVFREREREIAPERLLAWTWIYVNLGMHLCVRPLKEQIDLATTWKATWHLPRLSLGECARQRHRYRRPAKLYV